MSASAAEEHARDRDVTLLYLIKQVELAVRQALDDVVAVADLTTLQYTALTVLERHPGTTSAELARNSFVRAQTMAEMVTYLLGRGLVARERDEKNRKQYLLTLTSEGQRVLDALRQRCRYREQDARWVRRRSDRDPAHLPAALPALTEWRVASVASRAGGQHGHPHASVRRDPGRGGGLREGCPAALHLCAAVRPVCPAPRARGRCATVRAEQPTRHGDTCRGKVRRRGSRRAAAPRPTPRRCR